MKKINQGINSPLSLRSRTSLKKGGFTLFELLVSISIIGILTALATVSYSGAQKKARDARRLQDINAIQKAAEQYYSQSTGYVYPQTNAWTGGASWTPVGGNIVVLNSFPVDPKSDATYFYRCMGTCDTSQYCFCARVESTNNGNSSGNCTFTGNSGDYFCAKNQQ